MGVQQNKLGVRQRTGTAAVFSVLIVCVGNIGGRRCPGRMVAGFTTTHVISAYLHYCCEF